MTKDEQPEVKIIGKVLEFITQLFPEELKKAHKEYEKFPQISEDENAYTRGFLSYFLLQRMINGATPMEYAFSFPHFFTNRDKRIIMNFIEHNESLFKVKDISKNNKDFLLRDEIDGKEYLVKTIDFPNILTQGDYIFALIVKKDKGRYFFYGNVLQYGAKQAQKDIRKHKPPRRDPPDIDWEIMYNDKHH